MIVLMNEIFIAVMLGVLGAMLGSFAGAQVWRLRAQQLVEDKASGEKVDNKELKRLLPLTKTTGWRQDRSIDLDTGKPLAWYDLLPVISWLMLRGKSRHSGKFIGYFELVIEMGLAVFFVASFLLWPVPLDSALEISKLVVWLVAGVVLAIQFATDYKWQILWTMLSYALIALGLIFSALTVVASSDVAGAIMSAGGAVLVLGGLYFFLWAVSRQRWVGLGDAILGVGLGLLLADWQLALVALFTANLIGSIVVLGGFALKKVTRGQHVPFGPFLILGAVVAQLFGYAIIEWYLSAILV